MTPSAPTVPWSGEVPREWLDRGLVVLAGAGVSVAAPASVPSWWQFNEEVLAGLRRQFVSSVPVPVRARQAVDELGLDDLDLVEFSQVVHNAFAGMTWFDLLSVLDGEAPNATHQAIASLARLGVVRVVATTNFDTLFERALPDPFARFNTLLDDVPGRHKGVLVKLHGTADRPCSLVDLATQKRRGIPPPWRTWLKHAFTDHCVLVLGFSGADLELGEDYLGLETASAGTPWLGWNVRSGSAPHPAAARIVAACEDRGRFVPGDLPDVLTTLGMEHSRVAAAADEADHRVAMAVEGWLGEPQVDSDVCGVAIARLLDAAGRHSAASTLRSTLRARSRRRLGRGLRLDEAVRASLILGQLGTDDENDRRAMRDLDLAERALNAVVEHLRQRDGGLASRGEIEYARNMSNIAHGKAVRCLRQGDAAAAKAHVEVAWRHIQALPENERHDRLAAHWQNRGAIAWLEGHPEAAREMFGRAHTIATAAGDAGFTLSTAETLRRIKP